MKKLLSCLLLVLLATGCARLGETLLGVSDEKAGIFSNRSDSYTHAMVLIKLKSPPLLSTVKYEDGKRTFDLKHLEVIEAEQAEIEKRIEQLSPDIQIVYRYRMVLNALAVFAPVKYYDRLETLPYVMSVHRSGEFSQPKPLQLHKDGAHKSNFDLRNSVKFIGADFAHAKNIRGQSVRVGIIDSGIDYTHAMFGGPGTEEAYKAIDPKGPPLGFPNDKIVGGIDLAGDDYRPGSLIKEFQVPKPDPNPIDLGGHGTHVAGTVAGRGDGVNTYDGVAPDALLYAIKVFGRGGTTDAVVIAGLEYAADPNNDGDPGDILDVVNLSLGGYYGDPNALYAEAIRNVVNAGMVVVSSAGNEGDYSYIVGSPSVTDEAFSVASSVDNTDHLWRFPMIKFTTADNREIYFQAYEGQFGKPIAEAGDVKGPLVYVGLAAEDFDDALKARLKGKVALIDRGAVSFVEKVARAAEAGAIGVVVADNVEGEPFIMSGDEGVKFDIPTVMVTLAVGKEIREAMEKGDVIIEFNVEKKLEKPEIIDTISPFSSRGPRSFDGLVKPEIAAPGSAIISAWVGKGDKGAQMSGTSMASPHVAGAMALLKQAYPELSPIELKALAMGTAKVLSNADGVYPVSRQGAGRIQLDKALESEVLALPGAVSLGELSLESRKVIARTVELKNISKRALKLKAELETRFKHNLRLVSPAEVTIEAGGKTALPLRFQVDSWNLNGVENELDGFLVFKNEAGEAVLRMPVLAVANLVSRVKAQNLFVRSTSAADAQDAVVDLVLKNEGENPGGVLLFNLIGEDGRKADITRDPFLSRACDLAGVGYRVIEKSGQRVLQFAAKLHEPLSTWAKCHFSVLIDADGDGVADQELVGMMASDLAGLDEVDKFASVLLDAGKARRIRKEYDQSILSGKGGVKLNYAPSVVDLRAMYAFGHSTIALVEAALDKLIVDPTGALSVRIATSYYEAYAAEGDDYLDTDEPWIKISIAKNGAGYVDLPEAITLKPGESKTVSFSKGAGAEALWALYPYNTPVRGGVNKDAQAEVVRPTYRVDP